MEHLAHWSQPPSPHGLDLDDLVECLLGGLKESGVTVRPDQLVYACMPSLGRRGESSPPDDLLLDHAAAARHHADLVEARCLVMEIRGAGWLPGKRYLVLLDHAWDGGSNDPVTTVWAEARVTVWPLSVAWFERLERPMWLRPAVQRFAKRWRRSSVDVPVRPAWNVGAPAAEQGCPTLKPQGPVAMDSAAALWHAGQPLEGGRKMTTVFLSFAGAEPRDTSHVVEWAQRLRAAGIEVIDHEDFISYDLIMSDIARCDAMVAPVRVHGSTWASIEHTSAAYGRDTSDGKHGSWPPKPVLLWLAPAPDDHGDPFVKYPYLAEMLDSGRAVRLPDDFDQAVARALELITRTAEPRQAVRKEN